LRIVFQFRYFKFVFLFEQIYCSFCNTIHTSHWTREILNDPPAPLNNNNEDENESDQKMMYLGSNNNNNLSDSDEEMIDKSVPIIHENKLEIAFDENNESNNYTPLVDMGIIGVRGIINLGEFETLLTCFCGVDWF